MIYNELQEERKDKIQTSPQQLMVLHQNFIAEHHSGKGTTITLAKENRESTSTVSKPSYYSQGINWYMWLNIHIIEGKFNETNGLHSIEFVYNKRTKVQ